MSKPLVWFPAPTDDGAIDSALSEEMPLDLSAAQTPSLSAIFAFGGVLGASSALVDRYDIATDTWTSVAPMNTKRHSHGAAVVNGNVYVAGGEVAALRSAERYDSISNTWTAVADLPSPRYYNSMAALDGFSTPWEERKAQSSSRPWSATILRPTPGLPLLPCRLHAGHPPPCGSP